MKKRVILSLFLSFVLIFSNLTFAAAENGKDKQDKIEISFKVGDDTLLINGKPQTVEKPYVINGTTLVPLRVITEAFGSEVNWNGEEKSITLKYEDVTIYLVIGQKTAKVNEHEETLLEAPQLSPNGVTMVPLRFITETFGATVSYDEQKAQITVVKEKIKSDTISSLTNLPYIGDSYYGWSMDKPASFKLEKRTFDGCLTIFSEPESGSAIIVLISINTNDLSLDSIVEKIKKNIEGKTLTVAEVKTDKNGAKYAHVQYRDQQFLTDERIYLKNDLIYEIDSLIPVATEKKLRDNILNTSETFNLTYNDVQNTYDLSNVVDGYREFKDEKYKISFKAPADWLLVTDSSMGKENEIILRQYNKGYANSSISIIITTPTFSTESGWVTDSYYKDITYYNTNTINLSGLKNIIKNNKTYSYYTFDFEIGPKDKVSVYVIKFYEGSYAYEIHLTMSNNEKSGEFFENFLETLKVEPLDKEEIGILLSSQEDLTVLSKYTASKWETKYPSAFTITYSSFDEVNFDFQKFASYGSLFVYDRKDFQPNEIRSTFSDILKDIKDDPGFVKVIQDVEQEKIGDYSGYSFIIKVTIGDIYYYNAGFAFSNADYTIVFSVYIPEVYYGEALINAFLSILKNFSS